jgi:transcriptional regulator with XRE-family HTH domain
MSADISRAEVSEMVQRILKDSGIVLRQLADDSEVSYSLLRQWAAGHRVPTPDSVRRVALGMRKRIRELEALANEIEGVAGKGE